MNTDEKNCPYCGETIKAVAIKCKHCQSDLISTSAKETVETKSNNEDINCRYCGEVNVGTAITCKKCKLELKNTLTTDAPIKYSFKEAFKNDFKKNGKKSLLLLGILGVILSLRFSDIKISHFFSFLDNPKSVSSQSSVQTAKTTPKDTVSQNKINPVQLEKDSNDGLDIELNNVKFDLNPSLSTCQFFFTITNNTDYNITGFYSSGFLKDKNGSVISQIMQTDVVGRLKKGEENIVSFAFIVCKESDIKDLDSVSLNITAVSVNGENYFNNFDSVIRGKRTSRVPNIKNI